MDHYNEVEAIAGGRVDHTMAGGGGRVVDAVCCLRGVCRHCGKFFKR